MHAIHSIGNLHCDIKPLSQSLPGLSNKILCMYMYMRIVLLNACIHFDDSVCGYCMCCVIVYLFINTLCV